MASSTRSGKKPASADPTADTSEQQLAIRTFSPEQESQLDERFNQLEARMNERMDQLVRLIERNSVIQPSIETSPPALSLTPTPAPAAPPAPAPPAASPAPAPAAAPPAPPLPPAAWHPYKKMLKAEDVGYFDPGFQGEQEHRTTPGPVVNAGKHAYYLDIFVFVDRLNELSRKYGPHAVQDIIPSSLRGSALTWWTTEVDNSTKTILEAAELQPWIDLLIKTFRTNPAQALAALTQSRYTLRDLHMGITPRMWIHGQLSLARSADLGSTYNQLTIIWNQMQPYFQEQLAQPTPTTTLSSFLDEVDAKTTAWQNRAAHQQARAPSQSNSSSATPYPAQARPDHRGVQYANRPRIPMGERKHGKHAYMVAVADDGTPTWAEDDPDADDTD